jgi:hypothetical protein
MDFKFVNKNNIGAVATLVLIIILSQSRFFDFLIDTALGRAVLIMFILGISCVNKILGVVAVLFIIIMFNQSSLGYLEGFTQTDKAKDNENENENEKVKDNATPDGREGSNMVDRESAILKGKKSSELPLGSNARKQHDDVEPADKTTFTNLNSSVL